MGNKVDTIDTVLDVMLAERRDLRQAVNEEEIRDAKLTLSQRHTGILGRAAQAIDAIVPQHLSRRAFLFYAVAGAFGSVPVNVVSDLISNKINAGDDYSPSGWAVSPRFARLVAQKGYADTSFFPDAVSKGDLALVDSVKHHKGLNFRLLQDNLGRLDVALQQSSDADARLVIQSRILIDANLLGQADKVIETIRDISDRFDPRELTDSTIVRLIDHGSSVTLNCATGSELRALDVAAFRPVLDIYERTAFSSMEGDFRSVIPEFGLGIWTLVQAHFIKKMQNASPKDRHDVREEWLEAIIRHIEAGRGSDPETRAGLNVDAVYSMTRIAYHAALDGSFDQARRIVSAALYDEPTFDKAGCAEAKSLIRSRPMAPNSQWMHLLDVRLDLAEQKKEIAQGKMQYLMERRANGSNVRTVIVSLERGINEMNAFAFRPSLQDIRLQELPTLEMNRGYMDVLSI